MLSHPFPLRFTLPTGVFLLGLTLLGFVVLSETRSINERNEELIRQRAAALGEVFAPQLAGGYPRHPEEIATALVRLRAVPNLKLALLCDTSGRVVEATAASLRGRDVGALGAPLPDALAEARRTRIAQFAFSANRADLWAVFPIVQPEGDGVWFVTRSDVAAQKAPAFAALQQRALVLTALIAASCAGVWLYFNRTITRRAQALVAAAEALGADRPGPPTQFAGSDEISQLGGAFARMAHLLRERDAALRQNEARLRSIVAAEPECVQVTSPAGDLLEMNPAGLAILEVNSLSEAQTRKVYEWIVPEHRAAAVKLHERVLSGETGSLEFELIGARGTRRWLETRAVPLRDERGAIYAKLAVTRDITARKQAEVLRDTLLSLEVQLGAAHSPLEAGRVIFAAADRLWSWDSGYLEVCTWDENLNRTLLNIDVVDGQRRETEVTQPLSPRSARCRRVMQQGAELVLRKPPLAPPDDAVMFGDTTRPSASLMTVPIRWQSQAVGMLSVQSYRFDAFTEQDLQTMQGLADHCGGTLERLRATEELRRSEARLAEIYANMDDAVYVLSATEDGRLTYETFNPRCERVTGLTSAQVYGRSPDEVLPVENAAVLMPRYRECLASGRAVHYESDLTYQPGRHCWSTTLVPIRNEHGRIYRIAAISRDITEQKTAHELIAGQRDLFEHIAAGQPLTVSLEEICRFAEARAEGWMCSVLVSDPASRRLRHGAAPSLPPDYCRAIDGVPIGPGVGSCGTAAFRREAVTVTDIASDPLWDDYRELARTHGLRACWSTPIFGVVGEVLGTLAMYARESRRPDARHETAIRLAIHAASIALQQARAATDLRRSEERFETAFRSSPAAMILSTFDEGRLLEVNDAFLHIFGYASREEVLDRTSIELKLWPDPAERERCRAALLNAGRLTQFEQTFRTKSGEIRHSLSSAERIDLQGCPCVLSLILDITDRKQAEMRVVESEQARARQLALLEASFNNLTEGVVVCELDGRLAYWNHAARELHRSGSPDDGRRRLAEFKDAFEFLLPDGSVVPYESWPLARILRGETLREWEATLVHRELGWKRQIAFSGSLARDAAGQPLLGVVTMADITARRELEEQFRQAQKMEAIGQLAGGVAHDFNNILTAIIARAELAVGETAVPVSVGEALAEVRRLSQRAAGLTRQLLAFSRRSIMRRTHLNLNDVVGDDSKMIRRMVGEDIRLEIVLHAKPLPIFADEGMVAQVLLNLAVNARDAMPRGGRLTIETSGRVLTADKVRRRDDITPGAYACLSVRDSGEGIPPENIPRLFEPFFTTKPVGKGTGLGLAMVFGVVRQHKGTITVDSLPGQGTTFEVLLPIDSTAVAAADTPVVGPLPRGTETILLVEDEPAVRGVTRLLLKQQGYQVLEAEHGPAALKLWSQHRSQIALLLTDLVMPEGISGRELAARLLAESPRLKVVFMTGYSAELADHGAELPGGYNLLQKPFAAADLHAVVRCTLDGR